jgi:hypothetical protein
MSSAQVYVVENAIPVNHHHARSSVFMALSPLHYASAGKTSPFT